jgi:hypothetical protein
MLTKVLMSAAAAALISTAAYAQDNRHSDPAHDLDPETTPNSPGTLDPEPVLGSGDAGTRRAPPMPSTTSSIPNSSPYSNNTVNPPSNVETTVSVDPHAGWAPTGASSDVVSISPDQARAEGIPVQTVTNGPVPDTVENRARYGQPMSRAGKMTRPAGN